MTQHRLRLATWLLLVASLLPACQKRTAEPAKKTIGHLDTRLSVHVGGTWNRGYSVDVDPEQFALVESERCPNAKEAAPPEETSKGLCVVRITKDQSDRFAAAMERFKANAVPLETFSFEDPWIRPDGKPCQNEVTDSTMVSLLWTGTKGVKIATFYMGCDRDQFQSFYKSALAVTDPLPIQHIIGSD